MRRSDRYRRYLQRCSDRRDSQRPKLLIDLLGVTERWLVHPPSQQPEEGADCILHDRVEWDHWHDSGWYTRGKLLPHQISQNVLDARLHNRTAVGAEQRPAEPDITLD